MTITLITYEQERNLQTEEHPVPERFIRRGRHPKPSLRHLLQGIADRRRQGLSYRPKYRKCPLSRHLNRWQGVRQFLQA